MTQLKLQHTSKASFIINKQTSTSFHIQIYNSLESWGCTGTLRSRHRNRTAKPNLYENLKTLQSIDTTNRVITILQYNTTQYQLSMLSKPCVELYYHALSYCDMCSHLPFSTEYNSGVPGPQGAGAAPTLQWRGDFFPIIVINR